MHEMTDHFVYMQSGSTRVDDDGQHWMPDRVEQRPIPSDQVDHLENKRKLP